MRARISASVMLHLVIGRDGTVLTVDVFSGPEILRRAVLDAARQWTYEPTLLNGEPVEVDTRALVVFAFSSPEISVVGPPETPPAVRTEQPPPAPPEMPADSNAPAAAPVTTPIGGLRPADIPPAQPPRRALRIRVGASIQTANLIHRVEPIYPPEVKSVGVSGTVILHIVVSTDGSVEQVEFVSGPQELMAAAMSAVKQWRYRPTRLNGEPVEVDTTVTLAFSIE